MSDKRPHFTVEIKQVSNGFFLSIVNHSNYDKSETVHVTMREVHDAIDRLFDYVKDSFVALPLPIDSVDVKSVEVPF